MMLAPLLLSLTVATSLPDSLLSPDSALVALRKGGYTILWRHTATDKATVDAPGYPNTPRFQQRNLSERGVADAKAIGIIFKNRGIPIGDVLGSPMFRTRETAEYAFGRVAAEPFLLSMQPSADERRVLTERPADGTNRVLITHHFVIERNVPGIRPGDVNEGEAVVIRTTGDQMRAVAIFKMADWERLHDQDAAVAAAAAPPAAPAGATYGELVIPPLLATTEHAAIGEYLRTFNGGDVTRMRDFYTRSVVPNPHRTLDQRMETFGTLKADLGTLSMLSAEASGTTQVVVKVQGSTGKLATMTFTIEPAAPYRLASISIQTGG